MTNTLALMAVDIKTLHITIASIAIPDLIMATAQSLETASMERKGEIRVHPHHNTSLIHQTQVPIGAQRKNLIDIRRGIIIRHLVSRVIVMITRTPNQRAATNTMKT